MESLTVILLVAAVLFAALKGFGVHSGGADFGWIALACLFAGVFLLPALAPLMP